VILLPHDTDTDTATHSRDIPAAIIG